MAFSQRFAAKAGPEDVAAAFQARRLAAEEEERRREYEAEKARQATIARSKREAARRAMGPSGGDFGAVGSGGYGARGGGAFAWKKAPSAPGPKGSGKGERPTDQPSHDDCEMGISAMISRTQNGMKEGLTHLGLPCFPLVFVPGQEFKLCGHNLREEINEMIHAWMTDEKELFFQCLADIKMACENPLLTDEDMQYIDKKEDWKKTTDPDGRVVYARRTAGDPPADDDDDDEVIDIAPSGERLPLASAGRQDAAAPSAGREVSAAPESAAVEDDYYGLLGVDPSAPLQEIRARFRSLVVTEHPEKGGDVKKFQRLNKAYSVLSDHKRRQEFDQSRAAAGTDGPRAATG